MTASPEILDLRVVPHLVDIVADRVWRAWWKPSGTPFDDLRALVAVNLADRGIPSCYVAMDGDRFVGTVSLIANDLAARPALTPWLAALWVEPDRRGRGVGAALVARVRDEASRLGVADLYLSARPALVPFYEMLGWTPREMGVGPAGVTVLSVSARR